ncbi:MAG: hypothetical protein K8I02_12310, partial [Candidatus Methylomirabilis sp.]|nr:hypothetical protein [Deltaproteobacteria bacterium]
ASLYTAPLPLQLIAAVLGGLLGNDAQPFFFWGVQTSMAVALPPRYHTREDLSDFMDLDRLEASIARYIDVTDLIDGRGPDLYAGDEAMRMAVEAGPAAAGEPLETAISLTAPNTGVPVSGASLRCVLLHDDLIFQGEGAAAELAPGDYACTYPASLLFSSATPFQAYATARHGLYGTVERFVPILVP